MKHNRPVRFEIDSDAAVTIVSTHTLQKFCPSERLQSTELQLITYCKTSIKIVSVVSVIVRWKGTEAKLNLHVSSTACEPLLGCEWIRQLHIPLRDTINTVNSLHDYINDRIVKLLQLY